MICGFKIESFNLKHIVYVTQILGFLTKNYFIPFLHSQGRHDELKQLLEAIQYYLR